MKQKREKVVRFAVGYQPMGYPKGTWRYVSSSEQFDVLISDPSCKALDTIPVAWIETRKEAETIAAKLCMRHDVCSITIRERKVDAPVSLGAA